MIGTPSLCSADRKDSCNFSTDWQEVLLFSCYLCVHSQGLRKLQLRQNQQSHLQRKNPQKSQHLAEFQASFCRWSMFLIDWCFRLTPSIIFIQARKFGTCLNHFLKFTEYLPPVSFVIISHGLCLHADHFHHFSSSIIIFPDINSDVMMFPWYFPIFSTRTLAWREASPSRARGACGGVAKAGQKRNSSGFHGLFMGFDFFWGLLLSCIDNV